MSEWQEQSKGLVRELQFADFVAAFDFMSKAAEVSEAHGHHPSWCNTYNRVRIVLNTHDAGGAITEKDHKLAAAFDELLEHYDLR